MSTWTIVSTVVGGLIGYGWYRIVGCSSGTCPITSSPWVSTIFGMLIGASWSIGV
jgi:hypothetical protein